MFTFFIKQIFLFTCEGLNDKERVARQKQLLRKRLGLDEVAGVSVMTPANEELFKEEDFIIVPEASSAATKQVFTVN